MHRGRLLLVLLSLKSVDEAKQSYASAAKSRPTLPPPPPHPLQKKNQVQERSQKLHICTLFFEQSIMHGSIFCGTNPFPLSLLAHHQLFGIFYRVASIAIPVRKWVIFDRFLFFSVSVKVLPVTPMLSSVFVHRTLCAYFLRIKGVVEMLRIFNLICNGVGSLVTRMVF